MRIHYQVALALCVSVLFAACAPQPPAPQVDVEAERAAIAALGDEYVRLFSEQNVAGLHTMEVVRSVPGQANGSDRSTSLSDRPMTREKWTGNGAESCKKEGLGPIPFNEARL